MMVGYARVSTEEQNMDMQVRALSVVGCDKIFTDHGISGSLASRPGLDEALRHLEPGGKLVVWRLDRLGRSLAHLVALLEQLGRREVRFHSLNEHIDTSTSGGRLVFHMMAALAEFERALISERTRAGMAAARARGRHVGRRPSLSPQQCDEARRLMADQQWSLSAVGAHFGLHPRTVRRLLAGSGP